MACCLLLAACQVPQPRSSAGRPGDTQPGGGVESMPPLLGEQGDDPAHLKGLAAPEVVAKLGDPGYRRRESPAEVWQYFGPGCVLDVFLYDDHGAQRVTHAELRSHDLSASGQAACLTQVMQNRHGAAANS
jgi:hypothetical protein